MGRVTSGPTRFVVIGDATLDVIVRGDVPDAGADRPAQITVGPGGQGANVAVRLARAGNQVTLVSALADDEAGHVLRSALAEDGVTLLAAPAVRTGLVVALVDGTGDRSMLSDRAAIDERVLAGPEGAAILRDADWLHVSGIPVGRFRARARPGDHGRCPGRRISDAASAADRLTGSVPPRQTSSRSCARCIRTCSTSTGQRPTRSLAGLRARRRGPMRSRFVFPRSWAGLPS